MITAFIFDLDGTLFDSTEANVQAYYQAFTAAGAEFDEDKYRSSFGLRFGEMIQAIAPGISEQQAQAIRDQKPKFYKQAFDRVVPNTGLLSFLDSIHAHYKTALVTTASHENVRNLLAHFKVSEACFDVIITGEHVKHGKPDPECYLQAISRLDVAPQECCIFEDSDIGMQAANATEAHVIRVKI